MSVDSKIKIIKNGIINMQDYKVNQTGSSVFDVDDDKGSLLVSDGQVCGQRSGQALS